MGVWRGKKGSEWDEKGKKKRISWSLGGYVAMTTSVRFLTRWICRLLLHEFELEFKLVDDGVCMCVWGCSFLSIFLFGHDHVIWIVIIIISYIPFGLFIRGFPQFNEGYEGSSLSNLCKETVMRKMEQSLGWTSLKSFLRKMLIYHGLIWANLN